MHGQQNTKIMCDYLSYPVVTSVNTGAPKVSQFKLKDLNLA